MVKKYVSGADYDGDKVRLEDYLSEDSIELLEELESEQRVKDSKRRMKTVGLFAIGVSAAYLYGKSKGFDIGYDIGEMQGFREATKSILDGAVDTFNLGKLEE